MLPSVLRKKSWISYSSQVHYSNTAMHPASPSTNHLSTQPPQKVSPISTPVFLSRLAGGSISPPPAPPPSPTPPIPLCLLTSPVLCLLPTPGIGIPLPPPSVVLLAVGVTPPSASPSPSSSNKLVSPAILDEYACRDPAGVPALDPISEREKFGVGGAALLVVLPCIAA